MKKHEQVQRIIEEVYGDGNSHSVQEVRERCWAFGIDVKADRNVVSNVIFRLKKNGYLEIGEEKGVYRLSDTGKAEKNSKMAAKEEGYTGRSAEMLEVMQIENKIVEENAENRHAAFDFGKYFILKPQNARLQEMKIVILERGEIRMNTQLQKKIQSRRIEILLSRDYRTILLNPNGENAHEFTKSGTARNYEVVEMLRRAKLAFPITYKVAWNEKLQVFEGRIDVSPKK